MMGVCRYCKFPETIYYIFRNHYYIEADCLGIIRVDQSMPINYAFSIILPSFIYKFKISVLHLF
jgi:hypothetical protein